jgi:hypothetical protein
LRVLRLLKTVEGRKDPTKSIETTIKLRLAWKKFRLLIITLLDYWNTSSYIKSI